MNLDQVIAEMEKLPRKQSMPIGFTHAHSYRSNCHDLGVEPIANVTVGQSLDVLLGARGKIFQAYKGGTFVINGWDDVWIAVYGESGGDKIGELLLAYLLGKDPLAAIADRIEHTWPGHVQPDVS